MRAPSSTIRRRSSWKRTPAASETGVVEHRHTGEATIQEATIQIDCVAGVCTFRNGPRTDGNRQARRAQSGHVACRIHAGSGNRARGRRCSDQQGSRKCPREHVASVSGDEQQVRLPPVPTSKDRRPTRAELMSTSSRLATGRKKWPVANGSRPACGFRDLRQRNVLRSCERLAEMAVPVGNPIDDLVR